MRADIQRPRDVYARDVYDSIRIMPHTDRQKAARDSLRVAYAKFMKSAAVCDLIRQTGPWREPFPD